LQEEATVKGDALPIPPPEILKRISRDLDPLNQELKDAGGHGSARVGSP
jgi:hypothetical protein